MQNEKESKHLVDGESAIRFDETFTQDAFRNCHIPYPPQINKPYDDQLHELIYKNNKPQVWHSQTKVNSEAELTLAFIAGILYAKVTITEELRQDILKRIDSVINK